MKDSNARSITKKENEERGLRDERKKQMEGPK